MGISQEKSGTGADCKKAHDFEEPCQDGLCPTAQEDTKGFFSMSDTLGQWAVKGAVLVGAVVTVVPLVYFGYTWVRNYFYPQDSTIKIEDSEEEETIPAKEESKPACTPAPETASSAQAKSTPAKETPVVVAPKTNNNLIIGLIIACIIGMLITGYFVCIRKDEEDSDIENPEAPASGNRRNSQDSADIKNAAAYGVNF